MKLLLNLVLVVLVNAVYERFSALSDVVDFAVSIAFLFVYILCIFFDE